MHRKLIWLKISVLALIGSSCLAVDRSQLRAFAGEDLHIKAGSVATFQPSQAEHILEFKGGFSLMIGDNRTSSDEAIVWLDTIKSEYRGSIKLEYRARVFLQGNVSVHRGGSAKTTDLALNETIVNGADSLLANFTITGEVFVTADERTSRDMRADSLYKKALAASVVRPEPSAAEKLAELRQALRPPIKKPGLLETIMGVKQEKAAEGEIAAQKPSSAAKKPKFVYPVNIAPIGTEPSKIEKYDLAGGSVTTVLGRFYIWQKKDETNLLEFQADNAVIYHHIGQTQDSNEAAPTVQAVYLSGDVVMTEGLRTIKADEFYYDFQKHQGLVVNAEMKSYDPRRGIPVYVRAEKLRLLAEDKFSGENIVLTSSEFYLPQISMTASSIIITDTTTVDEQANRLSDDSYQVDMRDASLKFGNRKVFNWARMSGNFRQSDIPLRRIRLSNDDTFGFSAETKWHLVRVLGLRQPAGVDSSLLLDFYSKRGVGAGADISYSKEDYFGRVKGYIIRDTGQDDLGRSRTDLQPPHDIRGRFQFQHRQFLPYDWQLTLEADYLSDRYFLESYNRDEFNTSKERETLIHLKRIRDNWAFAMLGKVRINDFLDQIEEAPSLEYHLTGQSLFDDKLTFYSDSRLARLRQRLDNDGTSAISQERFVHATTRNELDWPIRLTQNAKIVPFVAGTFGYDDRSGFDRAIATATSSSVVDDDEILIGELGLRASAQYWKLSPQVRSKFWDLNGIRHIIKPYITAVAFTESSSAVKQRDIVNIGLSQRWQTKRGTQDNQRIVDWMKLNFDFTWVSDPASGVSRAEKFIWNRPFIPLDNASMPAILRGGNELFAPQRDMFNADYIWRVSDTTALLADASYDMQLEELQQLNLGFSRLLWPNLSYYIGSRYLKNVTVGGEHGSQIFTFASTYKLNPRYTLLFSHQYDFDYDARLQNEITLVRRYHRLRYALTYSADHSLDRKAVILSIWPEGVDELAIGSRRYMGLGD